MRKCWKSLCPFVNIMCQYQKSNPTNPGEYMLLNPDFRYTLENGIRVRNYRYWSELT